MRLPVAGGLAWWRAARRRRPVLLGTVFWLAFWSVSASAMVWLYSPGGLGDPDRDLRTPARRIGVPVCVDGCADSAEPAAAAAAVVVGNASAPSVTVRPTNDTAPSSKVGLPSLPSLPKVALPSISIDIDEVMTIAGTRYLHYRIDVTPKAPLGAATISANVPEQAWFTECRTQAGQRVCTDSYRGTGHTHQVSWTQDFRSTQTRSFTFWIHVDPGVEVGSTIANHAHIGVEDDLVTSADHFYEVPPLLDA